MLTNNLKWKIKKIVPDSVLRYLSGYFYGWHGNYSSWSEAEKHCTGYESPVILEKVKASALKVRDGLAAYERDSVIYNEIQYSFPVLSGLMWIAAQNKGKLFVLDFGGSLGSTYYQNKRFLDALMDFHWCIVEQPHYVKAGRESFTSDKVTFYISMEECLKSREINVILLSSVLQYIEQPFLFLEKVISANVGYIIIDRTPFVRSNDRLTVQTVHPAIYKAKYPCWFFNESKFVNYFSSSHEMISEFISLDKANIRSEFKGFIFKKLKLN
jgi:putative methyltransferase (TIGR04325 family)